MARPKSDRPSYCLHKQSGRARITIDGKQKLLPGLYGSPESLAEYDRLLGTWYSNGRTLPVPAEPTGPTVSMIALAFWRHAQTHYVDADGKPTGEADNYRYALRPLRRLYGSTAAVDFGPKALKALRSAMLLPQPVIDPTTKQPRAARDGMPMTRPGWSRTYANRQTERIKQVFRWAASEELVPAAVVNALCTVDAIRRGRDGARETPAVHPVKNEVVEQTLPHLPPPVAALVKLQLLTGARGGELFGLRTCDVDRSHPVWKARPTEHKTAHHGHARTIYFGPRAQEVLAPLLKLDLTAPIFSPADAHVWRNERQARKRVTPLAPSQARRADQARQRPRKLDPTYNKSTYARAIARACARAGVPPWHPHQLRHAAGTFYRREAGFEAAQILLGHQTDSMTQRYAERDERIVEAAVAKIG